MKTQRLSIALTACLIGTSALAASQEPAKALVQKPTAQRHLFLPSTEVMGHAVTAMAGEASVELGKIANLVVDSQSGSISHVVVQAGKKTSQPGQLRVVPFDAIQWTADEAGSSTAVLNLDPRAFDATPAFDPAKIDQLTGKGAVDAAAKRLGDAAKDLTDEHKAELSKKAREATAGAARSVLASDLAGIGIQGPKGSQPFARLASLTVDCGRGQVSFATVAMPDGEYLVPFQTLTVHSTPATEGGKEIFSMVAPTGAAGLVGAPMIRADQNQTASNPRFRASVYKHYGVKAPMGRRAKKHDGASRDGAPKKRAAQPKRGKVRKVRSGGGND